MNKAADTMHIVKAHKELLSDLSHNWHWDATVVILLYQGQQVLTQDFKCHHEVFTVHTIVEKPIVHLEAVSVLS